MIAIVDYKMGNLASVKKALAALHYDAIITSDPGVIGSADGVILPGVGAFAPAMANLKAAGLDVAVKQACASGKPFLGICLGMQLLFDGSEEGAGEGSLIEGLGIIPGTVKKFPADATTGNGLKVPQMGWNSLTDCRGSIFNDGDYVYFVHSFYCDPADETVSAAKTEYGIRYCCAVEKDNIFATQFHPEKSGEVGLAILAKFARRTRS
ncbi:MAG: imidazole glycerol phosphate synthase subunit HisH [Clostridiales bacterium]|nr:imidazole glycerol phosphate synthase subunit HisH [Clostridiales bacterium]